MLPSPGADDALAAAVAATRPVMGRPAAVADLCAHARFLVEAAAGVINVSQVVGRPQGLPGGSSS